MTRTIPRLTRIARGDRWRHEPGDRGGGQRLQFLPQRDEFRIRRDFDLVPQPRQRVGPPFGEIRNA